MRVEQSHAGRRGGQVAAASTWMPWFVGLVALLFTILAWLYVRESTNANNALRAQMATDAISNSIHDRLMAQIGLLRSAAGLFAASEEGGPNRRRFEGPHSPISPANGDPDWGPTLDEFRRYVARLKLEESYPGTQGIGFCVRLQPEDVAAIEARMRAAGHEDFHVWPEGLSSPRRPDSSANGVPDRAEYHSIIYLEPLDEHNRKAIGYDMFSEPTRRAAMEDARDTGQATVSGRVELIQEQTGADKQAGFLVYVPVYEGGGIPPTEEERRAKLIGFTYSPLRVDDFLRGIFGAAPSRLVDFEVYDGTTVVPERLMHRSNPLSPPASGFAQEKITAGGRTWTLAFALRPEFFQGTFGLAVFVLVTGLMVTAVLFLVVWSEARARTNAEATAEDLLHSQEALREHEARKSAILESALDCIITMDQDGRIVDFNPAAERTFGHRREDVLGRTVAEVVIPERLREAHWRGLRHFEQTGEGPIFGQRLELPALRGDGSEFAVELAVSPTRLPGRPTFFTAYIRDITERKAAEEELERHRTQLERLVAERTRELELSHERLRQSERLAALGTLSAGLGHDMGNLLLPLRLRLDAMESKGLSAEFTDDVQAIRKSTQYLQQLTNGLRLLALDPTDANATGHVTDLHTWWADVQPILKNTMPRRIELRQNLPPDLPRARLAPHLLTQLVFNLVQNAGDAMRARGEGFVKVQAEPADAGRSLRLTVTDNGPGMPPDVKARCMEPFFTTKARGISTGLGLALVHGIVQRSGGSISVESEVGRGTTFIVSIPTARAEIEATPGPRRHAHVSLGDQRMATYIAATLRSLQWEVTSDGEPYPPEEADLWILDPAEPMVRAAERFVTADAGRRALILGNPPYPLALDRVVALPKGTKPTMIREMLQQIAGSLDAKVEPVS